MNKLAGCDVWVTRSAVVLDYYKYDFIRFDNESPWQTDGTRQGQIIEMQFNNQRDFEAEEIGKGAAVNYIRKDLRASSNGYSELILRGIYSGTDLRLYTEKGSLRYDFLLAPGADPQNIDINFNGHNGISINEDEVILSTSLGDIRMTGLKASQEIGERETEVQSSFVAAAHSLKFHIEGYNSSLPLVIDPVFMSTFLGGQSYDSARGICVSDDGCTFITGYTSSSDFPTTSGAYQRDLKKNTHGHPDIFVSKFDSVGNTLLFSTFLGGISDDYAMDIQIDNDDFIYITGYCGKSPDFPVTNMAYDTNQGGGFDIFVTKLTPDCADLMFSSYIGGVNDDYGIALALDDDKNVYVTGYSKTGSDFPVTKDAFQSTMQGENDAFVCKLSADGTELEYSTLLGGSLDDFSQDILVNDLGYAYICGLTRSDDFPISINGYDQTYNDTDNVANKSDAFIAVIHQTGKHLLYSSFHGGTDMDGAYSLNFYGDELIMTGYTHSIDFPVSPDALDTTYNSPSVTMGTGDIFLTKYDISDLIPFYSTYLGGASTDRCYAMDIDGQGNIYMTGSTSSQDFPVSKNAFDKTYNDTTVNSDAFALKLSASGKDILYSTYLGGNQKDVGWAIDVFNDQVMMIAGVTSSVNFPTNGSAYDNTYNDIEKTDAFFTRLVPAELYVDAGANFELCYGKEEVIGNPATGAIGSATYTWRPSQGLSDTTLATPVASPENDRWYYVEVKDASGAVNDDSVHISVIPFIIAEIDGPDLVLSESTVTYTAEYMAGIEYEWICDGADVKAGQGSYEATIKFHPDIAYSKLDLIVTDPVTMCKDTAKPLIVIFGDDFRLKLNIGGSVVLCPGDTIILDCGKDFYEYNWSNGITTRLDTITEEGKYFVVVRDKWGMPGYSDTLDVSLGVLPEDPEIRFDSTDAMLICMTPAWGYQWFRNDTLIDGATEQFYYPMIKGWYKCWIYNEDSCHRSSNEIYLDFISVSERYNASRVSLYPNPARNKLIIAGLPDSKLYSFEILNSLGMIMKSKSSVVGSDALTINIAGLPDGFYIIRFCNDSQECISLQFVIRK